MIIKIKRFARCPNPKINELRYFFFTEPGHLHISKSKMKKIKKGVNIKFQTVGARATIYFPESNRLLIGFPKSSKKRIPMGRSSKKYQIKYTVKEGRYPFAVYCEADNCRDFAEGGTAPAIIVDP